MQQILLDTNFISALFDPRRPKYQAVKACALGFSNADFVYLSVIVLAELRFGMEAAQRAGQDVTQIRHAITQTDGFPVAEVGRHTAEAYADVKSRLASYYLKLWSRPPRWLENWQDRASGQMLQVDENDLWLVAQAIERDCLLVTCDRRLVARFCPAIAELRTTLI